MSLILVTGGVRSGKSHWAQQRAKELSEMSGGNVTFLATAEVKDIEMRLRVAQHRKARPRGWKTIEAPTGIAAALLGKGQINPGSVIVLDDVSMVVSNLMTGDKPIREPMQVENAVQAELRAVLRIVKERKATIIMVTNEVGAGIVPDNELARGFRDVVGRINQWLAGQAEGVWYLVSGMALPLHALATPVRHDD